MGLHKFNKDYALRRIKLHKKMGVFTKNGTLIFSICILFVSIMILTFAKFSTTNKYNVVETTVGEFSKAYKDSTGANQPVLYQGLIPVKYDASGNTVVADTTSEWYNYANHNWANAVLVNCGDSTIKSKYFNDDMTLK